MSSTATSQIDNDLYNRMSDTWWDENGSPNLLKSGANPWRVPYFHSKLTLIKIAQEWAFTRIAPPQLHVWEMFITPDELKISLERHGLQNKDIVGTKTSSNPIKMLMALRQYKAGKISGAEFGKHAGFKEGTNISGSYMDYVVKS